MSRRGLPKGWILNSVVLEIARGGSVTNGALPSSFITGKVDDKKAMREAMKLANIKGKYCYILVIYVQN